MSPAQSVAVKMGNPDSEEHNYAIARSLRLRLVFYTVPIRIVYNRDVKTNRGIRKYPEFPECREINAHAQIVCTRPSLSRGRPGNEANACWCTPTCVGELFYIPIFGSLFSLGPFKESNS